MGQFFDSRKFLRTPSFAPDGLYDDDETLGIPPPQSRQPMAPEPTQDDALGISGMLARAESLPPPAPRQLPRQEAPPLNLRENYDDMPIAPLPKKPGKMRNVLGTIAGMYLPGVGEAIKHPGHSDDMREYQAKRQYAMDRAKIGHQVGQGEAEFARAQAQMTAAEANNARRDAEKARAGSFGPPVIHKKYGEAIIRPDGTELSAATPAPVTPGLRISREEALARRLYVNGNDPYVEIPGGSASAFFNAGSRIDPKYTTLKQAIRDAHPDWEQPEVDAEASRLHKEQLETNIDKTKSQAAKNLRPPAPRAPGFATLAAEGRRTVDETANAAVAEHGDIDSAIAATTDKDVLLRLKAMKGESLVKGRSSNGKSVRDRFRAMKAKPEPSTNQIKPPPPQAPTTNKTSDPLGVR